MQNNKLIIGLIIAIAALSLLNVINLSTISVSGAPAAKQGIAQASAFVPTGIPEMYGTELSVNFDDVSPNNPNSANLAISKLKSLDTSITLTPEQNKRYTNILFRMEGGLSCEYCCGAQSIIFENGEPACGCAHSYAMRGLTKYLLTQHSEEYTDAEIYEEISKWKALFFPTQIAQKAAIFEQKGIDTSFTNLASNTYRSIGEVGGGMVGGC
jgi:hypothetical protein